MSRAIPDLQVQAEQESQSRPRRNRAVEKLLLRFTPWIKPLIAEAADREGISMNVWCARILAEAARASRNGFYSQPIDIETERLSLHKGGVVQPQPGIWPSTNPNIYPGVVTPNITPWVITSGTSTSSGTSATTTGTYTANIPPSVSSSYTSPNTTTVSTLFNFPDDDIPELT